MTNHPCPVCDSRTDFFDVVDFNKSCGDSTARSTGLSGTPIYYSKCSVCGFLFAPEIHAWSESEFQEKIYNEDYVKFDGDYLEKRPVDNVALVEQLFGKQKDKIRHLDYGGGNGLLSRLLIENGWNSNSFDPFPNSGVNLELLGKFNLITAFEVFEHVSNIHRMMENLRLSLAPGGVIALSTLLTDGQVDDKERLCWWYAAPRNGHISLFSMRSLNLLASMHGLTVQHLNQNLHVLKYKNEPVNP